MSELAHAILLQDQGKLEEAEACFRGVLAREPENDFVYGRLALCQLNQDGKRKEALSSIENAIRIKSDESFYHAVKALILSDLRRGKEAAAAADEAIALDPEDSFALAARATASCSLERWAEAEKWSRESLALDSDNRMAANILTHVLRLQGKESENSAAVAQLLEDDPEDSFAHVNAGWSALHRKDSRKAEEHFREALRLDPESDSARDGLIEAFRARSWFYRLYLSYCFYLQRFTAGRQWAIVIGLFIAYQVARRAAESISPVFAMVIGFLWLGLVMWVWLAPGIGNFLILTDRSARLALKLGEKWHGVTVGGMFVAGICSLALGVILSHPPVILLAVGLIASTVPASLTFGNESKLGQLLFGGITAYIYGVTAYIFVSEWLRMPAEGLSYLTVTLGQIGLIAAMLCTWLGNIPSLRRGPAE